MSQITDAPRALPALEGRPSCQDWAELAAQHCAAGQAQTVARLDEVQESIADLADLWLIGCCAILVLIGAVWLGIDRAITRAAERERYWRELATVQMRADQPRERRP